jgi:hypothetical protein
MLMRNRRQQLVRALEQLISAIAAHGGIGGNQRTLAMLADQATPQVFDSDLKTPTAGWTFLHVVSRARHG